MSFTFIRENQENGVLAPPTTTFMSIREHMQLLGATRAAELEVGFHVFFLKATSTLRNVKMCS